MADKRSDDFVVRLPDAHPNLDGDKGSFIPKGSSRRASAAVPETLATFISTIEGSGGASVVAYCLSSISMTLVNKHVPAPLLPCPAYLTRVQSVVGTVTILACKQLGMIKELDAFDAKRAQKCTLTTILLPQRPGAR
ncbi:GDP-mannose transporter [Tolypocladium paradoxum]|uniref:GDP-mannose transporter n=1 Tax=Tolypocladium paradoxum TaxID=94208 RepID=A0A2S4LAY2_9HYPO|nr:GDP-mannose transporter [Tolypocladium paradoxum]